jgi:hypothetical protein
MIRIADPATGSYNHSGNDSTLPGVVDAHIPFMIEDDRTDAEEPSGTELLENTSSSPAPADPDVSSISSILSHLSDIRGRPERNRHPPKIFEPRPGNGRQRIPINGWAQERFATFIACFERTGWRGTFRGSSDRKLASWHALQVASARHRTQPLDFPSEFNHISGFKFNNGAWFPLSSKSMRLSGSCVLQSTTAATCRNRHPSNNLSPETVVGLKATPASHETISRSVL